MVKSVLFAVLLAFATPAIADPDRVSVLIGSRHIGASGFTEQNPGLFLTWERSLHWSVGVYRNSYDRRSVAVFAARPVAAWRGGELSLFAGLAHYPQDGRRSRVALGDTLPMAGVQIRQGLVYAQIIPMDGKPVDALVSFGLTVPLK